MPISPEEHNTKRRDTKRRQRAVARAKSVHKKTDEGGREKFNFIFEGEFSEQTLKEMENLCLDNKWRHLTRGGLVQLAKEGKLVVKMFPGQPTLAGEEIAISLSRFTHNGETPPIRIYKIIVPVLGVLAFSFSYDRDTGRLFIG